MRACRSLEDFYEGDQAAHAGDLGSTNPKLFAQGLCATGRFNETPICGQRHDTSAGDADAQPDLSPP